MSLTALKTFLAASAPIAALVQGKIRPLQARQDDTLPYIILDTVSDDAEYELAGECGVSRLTAQVDCQAEDYIRAQQIGDAVRNRMSGPGSKMLDDTTWASSIVMRRNNTLTEPAQDGKGKPIFRVSMDFEIVYNRTKPDFT